MDLDVWPELLFVTKPRFDVARQLSGGLAQVVVGGRRGIIDKTGKVVYMPMK